MTNEIRELPLGCKIVNIHRGSPELGRDKFIYAQLVDDTGNLIISATLEYIMDQMSRATIGYIPPPLTNSF